MCSYLFYSFYLERCLRFFSFRFVFFRYFCSCFLTKMRREENFIKNCSMKSNTPTTTQIRYGSFEARSNEWISTICQELQLYLRLSICFSCLNSIVCRSNVFFGNSLFSLFFFEVFEREVRLLQKILRGIALPLTAEATILSGTLLKFTLR